MARKNEHSIANPFGATTHKQKVSDFKLMATVKRQVMWDKALTDLIKGIPQAIIAFFGFYFAWLSIVELAGKLTYADINVGGLFPGETTDYLAYSGWVVAAAAIFYGRHQRALRLQTVEKLHEHIRLLELSIDDERSSSNLARGGDTRPEDI